MAKEQMWQMFSGTFPTTLVALFLLLGSTSAVQKLNTINDLKSLNFGQSVPKHSLLLLHWFANTVDIDNNDVIRLTFNPDLGEYGSHHYGNYEGLLEPLPRGNFRHRYFTVGNINQRTQSSHNLPSYVLYSPSGYVGRNMDRIIFRVREQTEQVIDRVYLTQHYPPSEYRGTAYDPDYTYQITVRLLRQIREFSLEDDDDDDSLVILAESFGSNAGYSQLRQIRNIWGELACLGLFLFMVIEEKNIKNQTNKRRAPSTRRTEPEFVINIPDFTDIVPSRNFSQIKGDETMLKVTTGKGGKAIINWNKVPINLLERGAMVALYKTSEDDRALTYKCIGNRASGTYETSIPLNEGLQVRLHQVQKLCCFFKSLGEELRRGPEFKSPDAVRIDGFNARFQLFAKDGKACARLYVDKSFTNWRYQFKKSWVGFYSSPNKPTNCYKWWQWEWATKFTPNYIIQGFSDCAVFEYCSGVTIASGVQARFILQDYDEKACTLGWTE